jgi:hypothetical protein
MTMPSSPTNEATQARKSAYVLAMFIMLIEQVLFHDDLPDNSSGGDFEQHVLSFISSDVCLRSLISVIINRAFDSLSESENTTNKRTRRSIDNEDEQPPKRRSSRWDWERARSAVLKDYMGPQPIFDDRQFERMFRISRTVMQELRLILGKTDDFFTEKICVVRGTKTICPDVKILFALKQLAYGISPQAFLDYFQMGETTARKCLIHFAAAVNGSDELTHRFFRPMTRSDAINVCKLHKNQHGVDGMVGSLDCMHVSWKNCPVAWQGQFQGKEAYPSIVLEAMCDYNLYFWHHEFGSAGTLNDISIWDLSGLHKAFVDGTWSENVDFEYSINGELFNKLWVTVDGIYPLISGFVKTLSQPIGKKQENYSKWQEKTRKDIERAFGVLQAKFRLLVQRVELWNIDDIVSVVNCCLLLHNWMVTIRVAHDESESIDWYDIPMDTVDNGDSGDENGDGYENVDNGDSGDENGDGYENGEDPEQHCHINRHGDSRLQNGDVAAAAGSDGTCNRRQSTTNSSDSAEQNRDSEYLAAKSRHEREHRELCDTRTQMVENRWRDLYDADNFYRLQKAIYHELEKINWNFS